MSSAELLVFPSLHEGFGFPVLEAMSLGVPVVTSNRTALPEVGGDAVLYADPMSVCDIAAKMNLILSDKALANSLRETGRERARSFQWENTCAEIVDLCASLVETRQWQRQPALR
jgi:glycosyltransferase involved in cell wall biosynthesis